MTSEHRQLFSHLISLITTNTSVLEPKNNMTRLYSTSGMTICCAASFIALVLFICKVRDLFCATDSLCGCVHVFWYAKFLSSLVLGNWASQMWMQSDVLDGICFIAYLAIFPGTKERQSPWNVIKICTAMTLRRYQIFLSYIVDHRLNNNNNNNNNNWYLDK